MKAQDAQRLVEEARQRVDAVLEGARTEVDRVLTSLQEALGQGRADIDMTVNTPSETHRLATSRGKGPQDAHAPVLAAAGLTAGDAAKRAGWSEVVYSRCRAGKHPVPEKHALAMQEATRSEAYPLGIEPTAKFWPKGVRVIKK